MFPLQGGSDGPRFGNHYGVRQEFIELGHWGLQIEECGGASAVSTRGSRADPYSHRSATRGSVLDARTAGRYEATRATAVSKAATAANVTGSVASTP